ncbi:proline-specific peptidase [Myriangium duriaei CBS 260.36]|uniref:Proline-specific peptidase n=1 Tax=Myriangium duriaei CBS 260.36 TaxID=1168546 RepID=A0A9P4J6E7_9PEZI|nr:proline-specific peptidase [Myriangium duriaei CBS 260.36]
MDPPFAEGDIPYTEGTIHFHVPGLPTPCSTYYKLFGTLSPSSSSSTPVVGLHGGPGGTHRAAADFALPLTRDRSIPLIVYDQLGCGFSTNLDDEKGGDESFWRPELWMDELDNLLDYFGLRETGFDLLGMSWGAMLGADFVVTRRPRGLRRLVLGAPVASAELLVEGVARRMGELGEEVQRVLEEGVERGTWTEERYKSAYKAYMQHCMVRVPDPLPMRFQGLLEWAVARTKEHDCTNATVLGLSPIMTDKTIGSIRGWNVIPRLHRITVPTLIWNGEFDQSHDVCVQPFFDHIPNVRWRTFAGASHILTYESEELRRGVFELVGDFFAQGDVDRKESHENKTNSTTV